MVISTHSADGRCDASPRGDALGFIQVIVRDERWLTALSAQGKRPSIAVAVEVEECFLQCAKALLRSKLWESHEWPNLQSLPCAAEMLTDHVQMPDFDVAKMQTLLDAAYKNNLY